MLVTNIKTSRFVRFFLPLVTLTTILCSYLLNWNPIHMILPSRTTSSIVFNAKIPDRIWHSAKNDNLTDDQHQWIKSWTDTNPSAFEELLTDNAGKEFVRAYYQDKSPDIVQVYEDLPIAILRADLLRYLIVLAKGGYWSDLDVTAEKPFSEWIPEEYKNDNVDMIVGLEFDQEWHGEGTEVASQFCNWVFAARPSSRNLQVVVDVVIKTLKDIAEKNDVPISKITLEMLSDVVNVTGPKIMTIAIVDGLTEFLGRPVDDRDFHGIKRPVLVGDVLIMPGNSFAGAQNGFPKDQGDALASHHYEGSWKKEDAEAKERKKAAAEEKERKKAVEEKENEKSQQTTH